MSLNTSFIAVADGIRHGTALCLLDYVRNLEDKNFPSKEINVLNFFLSSDQIALLSALPFINQFTKPINALINSAERCRSLVAQISYTFFATYFGHRALKAAGFSSLSKSFYVLNLAPIFCLIGRRSLSPGKIRSALEKIETKIEPICTLAIIASQVALFVLQGSLSAASCLTFLALDILHSKQFLPSKISEFYQKTRIFVVLTAQMAILCNSALIGLVTLVFFQAIVWLDKRSSVPSQHSGKLSLQGFHEILENQIPESILEPDFDHIYWPVIQPHFSSIDWKKFEEINASLKAPPSQNPEYVSDRQKYFLQLIEDWKKAAPPEYDHSLWLTFFSLSRLPKMSPDIQHALIWELTGPSRSQIISSFIESEFPLEMAILYSLQAARKNHCRDLLMTPVFSSLLGIPEYRICRPLRILTKKYWQLFGKENEAENLLKERGYDTFGVINSSCKTLYVSQQNVKDWWEKWVKKQRISTQEQERVLQAIHPIINSINPFQNQPRQQQKIKVLIAAMLVEMGILKKKSSISPTKKIGETREPVPLDGHFTISEFLSSPSGLGAKNPAQATPSPSPIVPTAVKPALSLSEKPVADLSSQELQAELERCQKAKTDRTNPERMQLVQRIGEIKGALKNTQTNSSSPQIPDAPQAPSAPSAPTPSLAAAGAEVELD